MEEEEKEFANLNEGEERKAETGQDEGKRDTQKNRMEGRSEAKVRGNTKGREPRGEPHSTASASTRYLLEVANLLAQESSKKHPPAAAGARG